MDSHNCLTCRALISTLFFYCFSCRQDRAKRAKIDARRVSVAGMPPGQPLDVLGYLRPF